MLLCLPLFSYYVVARWCLVSKLVYFRWPQLLTFVTFLGTSAPALLRCLEPIPAAGVAAASDEPLALPGRRVVVEAREVGSARTGGLDLTRVICWIRAR